MADFMFFELIEYTLALCGDKSLFTEQANVGAFYTKFRALSTLSAHLTSEAYLSQKWGADSKMNYQYPQ